MAKENKIKTLFDGDLYDKYIQQYRAFNVGYIVKQSTYTLEIDNGITQPMYFMQNVMSDKAFKAANMIKADIKKQNLIPPDIQHDYLQYYKFSIPQILKNTKSEIYNVDIKSAYATVLLNNLIIKPETFRFLQSLKKQDRLSSVGMLASNKNHFIYNEAGELTNILNDRNPLANFFFFCIREVQNIMNDLRQMLGRHFLFYWVDGIYFNNPEYKKRIEDYLTDRNYNFSFEPLTEFTVIENKRNYTLFFKKENDVNKIFRISKMDLTANKQVIDVLKLFDPKNCIITKKK